MLKPSITRKKSKINGQIFLNIKESKKNPKISFKDAIKSLQMKLLTKEINQKPKTANLNPKYNINPMNLEENNNKENLSSRSLSARMNMGKNYSDSFPIEKKLQGELAHTINEIALTEPNGKRNKYLRKYQLKNRGNKNKKIKINLIDELEKFDIEQQLKMEKYLDEKRRNQIDLILKKNKISNSSDIGQHKNLPNRKKENNSGNEINKTITEEKTNEDEKSFRNIDTNKNNIIKDNDNKENEDINEDNEKSDFQEIKQKYFSQNIFTTKFPNTEYKFKYLNNFFEDKSDSTNLLRNYQEEKNGENKANLRNCYNPINNNPSNAKQNINLYRYDCFNLKQKSGNISPKILFKNSNDVDMTNTLIDSNRNNNIDQNSNSYNYAMISNRVLNEEKNENEINDMYKVILNSIDNKLYKRNKDTNRINLTEGNNSRFLASSNEKIWITSRNNNKLYINYFRDLSSNNRNNYYKDICQKYDKYNDLNIAKRHFKKYRIQNTNSNYFNRNYLREINNLFNE